MKKILMGKDELARKIKRLSSEIIDDAHGEENLVLIGIRSAGVLIAERIKKEVKKETGKDILLGILDISLYRDDFTSRRTQPKIKQTIINFDLTGKHIVLVDDVIASGRTVRAALDHIIDFGRPRKIRLCVLVDRGGREIPVEPTFSGIKIKVKKTEWIELKTKEKDGCDEVLIQAGGANEIS